MSRDSVPSECPPCLVIAGSEGKARLMMFRFPAILGVPPLEGDRTLYGAEATKVGDFALMPEDEWWGCIRSLAGEISRADYHYKRFLETVDLARERRKVAGGSVFGDPEAARAIYCEAAAYLTAARTLVDLVVYVAARRNGCSPRAADEWEASRAIIPRADRPVEQRYENVSEVALLRSHADWFNTLNDYRNCMNHRGWSDQSFGYFDEADTAPERDNPLNNVMLLPNHASIGGRKRPHQWSYTERARLDN